jgi:signal transduction histidine kinase
MTNSSINPCPQLLSLAVHEFRAHMSIVGGYLRMLERDEDEPLSERHRKWVNDAERSCARMVALLTELNDIGKLDAGLIQVVRRPIDIFALIADTAKHVNEAQERDVHLAVRGTAATTLIAGDAERLRSAFDAIFRAILREKAGPCTVVADRRRDSIDGRECAVVVVAEDGSVQAAYAAPRGPFDEKRGGMGLALPLARRVLESHGGQIWAPAADQGLVRGSAVVAVPLTE